MGLRRPVGTGGRRRARRACTADLIGRWSESGRWDDAIELRADGIFRTADGGGGRWTLDGDRLVMGGAGGKIAVTVRADGPDRLIVTNPDGSVGHSIRCTGAETAEATLPDGGMRLGGGSQHAASVLCTASARVTR